MAFFFRSLTALGCGCRSLFLANSAKNAIQIFPAFAGANAIAYGNDQFFTGKKLEGEGFEPSKT